MNEWRTDRAAEIGRTEWAAMAEILYPPEKRNGGCSDDVSDRIAIHTTYEAVMKLRAEMEQVIGRVNQIDGQVKAVAERATYETLLDRVDHVPAITTSLITLRVYELALAGFIVWEGYHWFGWIGGFLAYSGCCFFDIWRDFRAELRRINERDSVK